jgi:hypothetical protein
MNRLQRLIHIDRKDNTVKGFVVLGLVVWDGKSFPIKARYLQKGGMIRMIPADQIDTPEKREAWRKFFSRFYSQRRWAIQKYFKIRTKAQKLAPLILNESPRDKQESPLPENGGILCLLDWFW